MSRRRDDVLNAVEMMRSIRDELSQRLKDMTHDQQRQFITEQLAETRTGHDEAYWQRAGGNA